MKQKTSTPRQDKRQSLVKDLINKKSESEQHIDNDVKLAVDNFFQSLKKDSVRFTGVDSFKWLLDRILRKLEDEFAIEVKISYFICLINAITSFP